MSAAQEKKCSKCDESKSLENFYTKDKTCKRCRKDISRRRIYGISTTEWEEIYNNQEKKCAICKKQFKNESKAQVDHNHASGQVRGLLCSSCNLGIGHVKENPVFLLSSCNYLLSTDNNIEESADVAELRNALKKLSTCVDEIDKKKNDKHES